MTTTPGRCECNAHKDAEPPQPPPELHPIVWLSPSLARLNWVCRPCGKALVYAQAARWAISERG